MAIISLLAMSALSTPRHWQYESMRLKDVRDLPTDTYNCAVHSSKPNSLPDTEGRLCAATVLSQTQIIFSANCRKKRSRARVGRSLRLVCLSGAIELKIPEYSENKRALKGFSFVKLNSPLPILPPKIEEAASDYTECKIHTPKRTIEIKTLSDIDKHRLENSEIGSSVRCLDQNGDPIILGIFTNNKRFKRFSELDALTSKIDSSITLPDLRDTQSFTQSCIEGENCIDQLDENIKELTDDIIKVIEKLNSDLKAAQERISEVSNNEDELDKLKSEFDDIRYLCQKTSNEIKALADDKVDTNWRDSVMGFIEGGAIATVNGFTNAVNWTPIDWDYKFLLNQFKDVEILKEHLSDSEFDKIYEEMEKEHEDKSNIDKIKLLTNKYAQEVVKKISKELNIQRRSDISYDDFTKDLTTNFNSCLKTAVDKETVLECADKFSLTAAVKISKIELENQLVDNFASRFDADEFKLVSKRANQIYTRCINQYFYNEKVSKDIVSSDKAKACVYEAILAAYEKTKEKELNAALGDFFSGEKKKEVLKQIEKEAHNCHLGPIINSPERLTNKDYATLSLLEVDDYKKSLFSCVEKLSVEAGRQVISASIKQNDQVIDNIKDETQISLMATNILKNEYKNCLELQKNRESKDPNACRNIITAVTTVDVANHVMAQKVDEMFESSPLPIKENLKTNINKIMTECRSKLSSDLQKDISNNIESNEFEKDINQCLSNSIDLIVKDLTPIKISDSIDEKESIVKYKKEILKDPAIKGLTSFTRKCFKDEFSKYDTVEKLTSNLDAVQEKCIFKTEKRATDAIALIIMNKELSPVLNDEKLTSLIINGYRTGKRGLSARIAQAKNSDELNRVVALITPDLTKLAAKRIVPKLVDEYLEDFSKETKDRIKTKLVSSMNQCIAQAKELTNDKIEEKVNFCMNQVTSQGYKEIGNTLISKNIDDVIADFPMVAARLKANSNKRINKCINAINTDIDSEEYKVKIELCLTNEIYTLSHSIPREALIAFSPNTDSRLSKKILASKMTEIEREFAKNGSYNKKVTDPLLKSHVELMSCLHSARSKMLNAQDHNISNALDDYPKCTDKVEPSIKSHIANGFSKKHSPDSSYREEFRDLGLTLTSLSGKKESSVSNQPNAMDETGRSEGLTDSFRLMNMVGEKTATACAFSARACKSAITKTKNKVLDYKKNNPDASSDELVSQFIDSPIMDEIIKTELAATLRVEFIKGLSDYKDSKGIMNSVIRDITSPKTINELLRTPHGKDILRIIKEEIENDNMDAVGENKKLRRALAKAITYRTNNDSIVDKLLYGIVQPMLDQERESSNGVFGIFKNFKTSLGRVFRIVRARDFKWSKIRNTKEGRAAREIFAKQLFAPIIEGQDLEKKPATNGKSKNFLDQKSKQLEDLIIKGLKSL
jgi:hypothetical protein